MLHQIEFTIFCFSVSLFAGKFSCGQNKTLFCPITLPRNRRCWESHSVQSNWIQWYKFNVGLGLLVRVNGPCFGLYTYVIWFSVTEVFYWGTYVMKNTNLKWFYLYQQNNFHRLLTWILNPKVKWVPFSFRPSDNEIKKSQIFSDTPFCFYWEES